MESIVTEDTEEITRAVLPKGSLENNFFRNLNGFWKGIQS
jgi:hypothetical protein